MHRLLLATLFLFMSLAPARAGAQSSKATLLRLEDEWGRALVNRDGKAFAALLAPGFVYSEDDKVIEREALIRDIVSGTDTITAAKNEDMRVIQRGNVAVVLGWLTLTGRGASGAFMRKYRFTDTWIRTGGRWRVLAAHDYLVPVRR